LEVREGRHGRGVFAARAFAKGERLEVCHVLELPGTEVVGKLGDYVFGTGDDDEVLLVLGYGMLYNHSAEPNAEYVEEAPRTITFLALRDVRAGEELTIDYGEEWWETRDLEPG
jgi:hypothetical protein